MNPRDLKSLLDWLLQDRSLDTILANPLSQWGPASRPMKGANFLPPKLVEKNQDTIEDVRFRTVAAQDGTRYSPAQLVGGGEMFGKIHYRLGHSDLMREISGPDYDGIVRYLNANMGMQAAAKVVGLFDTFINQAMVEHDELAIWEAIVSNSITRRGANAYFEYDEGIDLSSQRVTAQCDWTDADTTPWTTDILPSIRRLVASGYQRSGIRIMTTDQVLMTLAEHPQTARYLVQTPLATGQSVQEATGVFSNADVTRVFLAKMGIMSVDTHDIRIQTETGELRAYPESNMTFIASTGRSEEVLYNVADPSQVKIVPDVIGFNAIGVANGVTTPGRQGNMNVFTGTKAARIEFEGWQASGPVILNPQAIANISAIDIGTVS